METEAVLNLFHSLWFDLNVLNKISSTPSTTTTISSEKHQIMKEAEEEEVESSEEPKLARIQTSHTRSMSDQSMTTSFKLDSDDLSPDSVLLPNSKLQTILSGKEVTDSEAEDPPPQHHLPEKKNITKSRGIRRKRKESKSLSDLEFEELKGFMDLGFVFSEEDKDSTLASIIPGLQRLGKKDEKFEEEEEDFDESMVQRPYLSEAWEVYDRRNKRENLLMNWKVPDLTNETDIKDSLRRWAHTVASTVR